MRAVQSRRLLLPLVFVSGMASLAAEFGASRLLAPYFGTSLYVWGVLIGLILIYLSAGYMIGGRLADRHPRPELLYQITAWAGLWIGVIPLVSYPILLASQQGFRTLSVGLVAGTLLAVVLLFAVPVTLLGCVSPFAIRLLLTDVATGGNTAGRVYALSTVGSILGTFVPVFWLIPTFGTRPTIEVFGLALVVISGLALWPKRRLYASFAVAVIIAWAFLPGGPRYFHLGDAHAHEVVADARYWLDTQAGHYDVLVLDAYRQPYIPFHLTTSEFFQQVKAHLNPGGALAVNVGRTATDYRLVSALASTMAAVFPSVFLIDDPNFANTVVYASTVPVTVDDVAHNLGLVSAPLAS